MITLTVNGVRRTFEGDPTMPLLWYLRDDLALTGAKYGCGVAQCGSCTVHVGGQPTRACQMPMAAPPGSARNAMVPSSMMGMGGTITMPPLASAAAAVASASAVSVLVID